MLKLWNQRQLALFSSIRGVHRVFDGLILLVERYPVVGEDRVRGVVFSTILHNCHLYLVVSQYLNKFIKLLNRLLMNWLLAIFILLLVNIVLNSLMVAVEIERSDHYQMRRESFITLLHCLLIISLFLFNI